MLIGSYNTNYSCRQVWIHVAIWSAICIVGPVCLLIQSPGRQSRTILVMGIVTWLLALFAYLWLCPWRLELTADEFRWHTVLRTGTVPLSRVQSIRRGSMKNAVYVKIDGRRWDLWIEARPGRLGTFADDLKAAAPHVAVALPIYSWKGSVGWTQGTGQWDNPNNQIVSCDANGGKYLLGPAVFTGADLTGATAGILPKSKQWVVNLTLDSKASAAFGRMAAKQANEYYPGSEAGNADDAVLDQTAFLLDGNVLAAPQTQGAVTSGLLTLAGPQPEGFTQAQAEALAARW